MRRRGILCCACSVTTSGCCPSFLLSQRARKELTRRGLSSETSKKELRDLWPVEPVLAAKRNNALQPHIVFLEGGAGTGKGDILWRLKKIGYETVSLPFITGILAEGSRSAPNHHLTHVSWLHLLIDELDRYRKPNKQCKDNIVFVSRSPLSSFIRFALDSSTRGQGDAMFYRSITAEIKQSYNASLVMCKSDLIRTQERLGLRYFHGSPEEQSLRESLGETEKEKVQQILTAYDSEAKREGSLIDASIDSTSTKQGTSQLLKILGVPMDWVWDGLKQKIEASLRTP